MISHRPSHTSSWAHGHTAYIPVKWLPGEAEGNTSFVGKLGDRGSGTVKLASLQRTPTFPCHLPVPSLEPRASLEAPCSLSRSSPVCDSEMGAAFPGFLALSWGLTKSVFPLFLPRWINSHGWSQKLLVRKNYKTLPKNKPVPLLEGGATPGVPSDSRTLWTFPSGT